MNSVILFIKYIKNNIPAGSYCHYHPHDHSLKKFCIVLNTTQCFSLNLEAQIMLHNNRDKV